VVRNEATAEDLISEVFLDVWRQAGKFEGRSAASTWMLSIDVGIATAAGGGA
jgi:RNA polymerase sigma-70 factor (ECF subfamily)